jgi:hypothetical protein
MRHKYFGAETDDKFTDWFEQMKKVKEYTTQNLQVDFTDIDINNNGKVEKVLITSFYNFKYLFWHNTNYVVDAQDNLNPRFKEGATSSAELFRYKGRIYGYGASMKGNTAEISEFTPAYIHTTRSNLTADDIIGLQTPLSILCTLAFIPTPEQPTQLLQH